MMKRFGVQAAGYVGKAEGRQSGNIVTALWGLDSDCVFARMEIQHSLENQHFTDLWRQRLPGVFQMYVTCMDIGLDQNTERFRESFLTV